MTTDTYYSLGKAYGNQKRYMQALLAFDSAEKLSPFDMKIKYQLGVVYQKIGNYQLSTNYLQQFMVQYTNDFLANFMIGENYMNIEDYENAIMFFEKANEISENNYKSYYLLGRSYLQLDDIENAAVNIKISTRLNQDYGQSHFELAKLYVRMNKINEASKLANHLYMLDRDLFFEIEKYINN